MDPILYEYTAPDSATVTELQIEQLVPHGQKILEPKEASQVTYKLIEALMVNNCERQALKLTARYFSKQSFEDLIQERVTNHCCGYPLCKYSDSSKIKAVQLSRLVTRLKMPGVYTNKYCCRRHYQCAEFLQRQLSDEALFMRVHMDAPFFAPDTPESTIVLLEECFEAKQNEADGVTNPQMRELLEMMDSMQIDGAGGNGSEPQAHSGVQPMAPGSGPSSSNVRIVEHDIQ